MYPSIQPESITAGLWRHRFWLIPGVLIAVLAVLLKSYTIQLVPPSLERDSAEFAAASTQVLVDFPKRSSILDIASNTDPLVDRANIYSRLAPSPAVLELIARRAGIDAALIDARGPFKPGGERLMREPTAERRATQLRGERDEYRLRFDSEPDDYIPVVNIYSTAPTVAEATRLADAAADGLRAYVARIEREDGLPADRSVRVRPLGTATGGVVNPGADRQIALLTFAATFVIWCLVVLLVSGVWRRLRNRLPTPGDGGAGDWQPLLDTSDTKASPFVGLRQ